MAEHFELTESMRAAIGPESDLWPVEFTTTGIRSFARGVGYDDPVYFDIEAARAAGYASLPAPPTYAGIPVFLPGKCDSTYGLPVRNNAPKLDHGLKNILDGGTEFIYERVPVAGETLVYSTRIVDAEVKESKALGKMLVVTSEAQYKHPDSGEIYFRTRSQLIAY
jgi:hypothetical protein